MSVVRGPAEAAILQPVLFLCAESDVVSVGNKSVGYLVGVIFGSAFVMYAWAVTLPGRRRALSRGEEYYYSKLYGAGAARRAVLESGRSLRAGQAWRATAVLGLGVATLAFHLMYR